MPPGGGPFGRTPVEVPVSHGPTRLLHPGVVDEAAIWVYTHGHCFALAAELARRTGWPLQLLLAEHQRGNPDTLDMMHAYVEAPVGRLVDIRGYAPNPLRPDSPVFPADEVLRGRFANGVGKLRRYQARSVRMAERRWLDGQPVTVPAWVTERFAAAVLEQIGWAGESEGGT